MLLVIFWLVLAVIVGVAANARGRSGVGWFVLAVIISPVLAILFLLAFPDKRLERLLKGEPADEPPSEEHPVTGQEVVAAAVGLIIVVIALILAAGLGLIR